MSYKITNRTWYLDETLYILNKNNDVILEKQLSSKIPKRHSFNEFVSFKNAFMKANKTQRWRNDWDDIPTRKRYVLDYNIGDDITPNSNEYEGITDLWQYYSDDPFLSDISDLCGLILTKSESIRTFLTANKISGLDNKSISCIKVSESIRFEDTVNTIN